MSYWKDVVIDALNDAGLTATEEQLETVTGWVEGAHEHYGMAHGHDMLGNYAESSAERELKKIKEERDQTERWIRTTSPCRKCLTTGTVFDGWGRTITCYECNGEGRT